MGGQSVKLPEGIVQCGIFMKFKHLPRSQTAAENLA